MRLPRKRSSRAEPASPLSAAVFVRNTAQHDARVLRIAGVLKDLGYRPLIVGVVSNEVRERSSSVGGVRIVRLEPRSPLARLRRAASPGSGDHPGRAASPARAQAHDRLPGWAQRLNRLLTTLSYYRHGIAAIRRLRPRIVHCNDYNTMWLGVAARLLTPAVVIYDAHELWPDRNGRPEPRVWLLACEWLFMRVSHATITTSPAYAEVMSSRYRVAPPTLIRNIPEQIPSGPPPDPDQGLVVYVGAVTTNRGLEQAISALPDAPDARLRILGPGRSVYRRELWALAERLAVAERVQIVDPVAPSEVSSAIRNASAGLALIQATCLSYSLSLPNKLFEYLAAGLPILGADIPTIGSFVRENGVGIVVDERDPRDVARGFRELCDPARQASLRVAVARATATMSWQCEKKSLALVYRHAISGEVS